MLIRDAAGPQVLLGRRRRKARAFPGEYVFPGGLVEAADRQGSGFAESLPVPVAGLDRKTRRDLAVFARTALRECYEETGLLLASRERGPAAGAGSRRQEVWRAFAERALAPAFAALLPVARAITPLGYPRRFHSRFFLAVLGAAAEARPADPARPLAGDGELQDLAWVPLAETRRLPLAEANAVVLDDILTRLLRRHPHGEPRFDEPWQANAWPGALAGALAPCFTCRGPQERQYRTVIPGRGA